MQIKKVYYVFVFLVLLTACKKEETPPSREEILMGGTWSLFSRKTKTTNQSTQEIIVDEVRDECTMKSRVQFLANGVVRYVDNCYNNKEEYGTWGLKDNEKRLFVSISVLRDRSTGFGLVDFGFPETEPLSFDETQFTLKYNTSYTYSSSNGSTNYNVETTYVYKKVD